MPEQEDHKLLEWLKDGSLEAYEALFKKYYKVLCLQAILLLGDNVASEDLVQELFIEFWDKKMYRKVEQSIKSYLYSAVKNRCINELKRKKVFKKRLDDYAGYRQRRNIPLWLERKELESQIGDILLELPTQRLRAFTLVYLENKKYREAADEMGVSINSVKTHLKLALQILRDKLSVFR